MAAAGMPLPLNPWEVNALNSEYVEATTSASAPGTLATASATWGQVHDPIIYPGLYSATGFDIMYILTQVVSRPNPTIELGPVDCSVSIILCDMLQPDCPIVYASDSFCELTGYSQREILGKNCRFLQQPHKSSKSKSIRSADKVAIQRMREAIHANEEIQLQITNYKKNGQRFTNILSIIPLELEHGHPYAVGFQVEKD